MKDKTEFLFESDAEKVAIAEASNPKKVKLSKIIIRNSIMLSLLLIISCYFISDINNEKIAKLTANINNSKITDTNEKLDNISNLITYDIPNNKYEIVVNALNPISESDLNNYEIINVKDNIYDNIKLEKNTYNNYLNLKQDLLKKGYYINIKNGYNTFDKTKKTFNNYVITKGKKYAKNNIAYPGTTEHNTGLALDFTLSTNKNSVETDYNSIEYQYLNNIAYLYGFIIRYPKDKEIITGYKYEPYHLRYVGYDLAKYLKKSDLTLEEYYKLKG